MPKFLVTALVGTKYEREVEAPTKRKAEAKAFSRKGSEVVSPQDDPNWSEVECDTWTDVHEIVEVKRSR